MSNLSGHTEGVLVIKIFTNKKRLAEANLLKPVVRTRIELVFLE